MATSVLQLFTLVRSSINDPNGDRFDATDLLILSNRVLHRMFTERKDLFLTLAGTGLATVPTTLLINSNIPVDDEYAQLFADMIVAEIELGDDEEANQARAGTFDARSRR